MQVAGDRGAIIVALEVEHPLPLVQHHADGKGRGLPPGLPLPADRDTHLPERARLPVLHHDVVGPDPSPGSRQGPRSGGLSRLGRRRAPPSGERAEEPRHHQPGHDRSAH